MIGVPFSYSIDSNKVVSDGLPQSLSQIYEFFFRVTKRFTRLESVPRTTTLSGGRLMDSKLKMPKR